jgi:succinoglycan biosynthesis protein ExoL
LQALWRGALALCRGHRRLAEVEVLVARNLDMALLALLFRGLRRRPIPLIYQCFDIHSLMTARGPGAALARWLERRVLARAHRLVVSAPAFGTQYFRARQDYTGPVHLMENKIYWGALPPPRPAALRLEGPLRLGWVGTLRCPETFALLRALAVRMGPRVSIHLRGVVHAHQLPNFEAEVARHGNLHYEGRYDYPHGLARAYAGLDAIWAQDLWQPGGNSEWLLPNRIYEAGYFGCPCIAVAGSATARRIEADQSGICVPAASPRAVETALLAQRDALPEISARPLSRPVARYCQQPE